MVPIVVDASVSVKWFNMSEDNHINAMTLLDDFLEGHNELHVPEIWFLEVTQSLSRAVHRGNLTEQEGSRSVHTLKEYHLNVHANTSHLEAYLFARQHTIQVYDALYVLLAQKLQCEYYTADVKTIRNLHKKFPFVRWIGEYTGIVV